MSAHWEETLSACRGFGRNWHAGMPLHVNFKEAARETEFDVFDLFAAELGNVEPMYVSEDVARLWEHAWPSFDPESLLHRHELIVSQGFALLPFAADLGARNRCRALLWLSDETQAWAFGLSHLGDGEAPWTDASPAEIANHRSQGPWAVETIASQPFVGVPMNPERKGENGADLSQIHCAFWRLAQQVIAAPERLPRARRREEARNGSAREAVTVLRLRRTPRREPESEVDVHWSRRWIVRGHWRNQFYPRLGVHRQIWVSPHVKGPDDKPLVLTDRVVEFVR